MCVKTERQGKSAARYASSNPPPPPPAPPGPPVETNVLFGSVLLTLLFAASLTLAVYCIFFFFQLRYSFSFRGRFWTPTTSSALTTLRASTTLKGRVRLIRAALFASGRSLRPWELPKAWKRHCQRGS